MVQESPKDNNCQLAFCTVCAAAYLLSSERPHSPCHATDPVLVYDLESLFESVQILAELARGGAGAPPIQLSQEPPSSGLPESPETSGSQEDGFSPDSTAAPPEPPDAPVSAGVEAGAGAQPATVPSSRRRPSRARTAEPVAAAS